MATIEDFLKLDIRVGSIVNAEEFPEAHKPAYKLTMDFGSEIGLKRSSAQITKRYKLSDIVGKKVLAVVNFPPRQIGPFISEVLLLGVPDKDGHIILIQPENTEAIIGGKLH